MKTIYIILAVAALLSCAFAFHTHSLEIIDWIDDLGWLAPIFFVIAYGLAAILFLPTMFLTLAGGVLFGPILGVVFNLAGAVFGAALSFLITRHLIWDWFTKKRKKHLRRLIESVNQKGWVSVAFLRLFPVIPFNLVNYGLGLTQISFKIYLITTIIFLIPAEIIYTYFGYASRHALINPEQFYKSGGLVLLGLAFLFLGIISLIKKREQYKI